MTKVAYTSFISDSDWKRVSGQSPVELVCGLDWRQPEKFAETLEECDLAILRFDAYWNLKMLAETPKEFLTALLRKDLKLAVWSEDSHHVAHLEAELAPLFDFMFTAHSQYMQYLPEEKIHWIPCSFNSLSIDQLLLTNQQDTRSEFKRDLIFPFRRYPDDLTSRNQIADSVEEFCQQNNIRSLIGEVGAGDENQEQKTCNEILSSRSVLNVSLREEMNQRVFTAMALNRPMLCDRAFDMDYVDANFDATVFLDRDLNNLQSAMDQLQDLWSNPVQTADPVLKKHMHVHRVCEMINTALGTDLEINIPELDWASIPETVSSTGQSLPAYEPFQAQPPTASRTPKGIKSFLRSIRRKFRKPKPQPIQPHSPENFRKVVGEFVANR